MNYTIIKQKRKTASISVSETLEVIVKVPIYLSKGQINEFIKDHEAWIEETLAKKRVLKEEKDWYQTGKVLYLGKYWPVTYKPALYKRPQVVFREQEGFIFTTDGTEACCRQLLEQFYRTKAKLLLEQLTKEYAAKLKVNYQRVTIRKQATRWGSCSLKGGLSYNLKLMCAPIEMIEYVVLHEVMHLIHFNHSQVFWRAIEEIMPDYKQRMNYFKQFGQNFII